MASAVMGLLDPTMITQAASITNGAIDLLNQATNATNQNQVVVVDAKFCASSPTDLVVKKMALGDYEIKNVSGNVVFKVKAEFPYYQGRRVLSDASGVPILSMARKLPSAHNRWQVYRGNSKDPREVIFTAKQPSVVQLSTEIEVFLVDNKEENISDYNAKGSLIGRSCTIYKAETNTIIAQNQQKLNISGVVLGRNTFMVTVYPQVDQAFIAALIVLLDTMCIH
ncbi:hypothetical protein IFM89_021219 [Coptis chinensis]|uniref:Uncharacterized protein n=1 Tax=Coptis chinensis TaxID=261450 RepID=A0A835HG37_9MAGN|nr:hypothetical protein IFM89_021219 [Coptis chinensis]